MRGLDVRSNLLTRQGDTASDLLNVLLDSKRRLVNRPRFDDLKLSLLGLTGEIYDIVPYNRKNKLIIFTRANFDAVIGMWEISLWEYDPTNNTLVEIPKNNYGTFAEPEVKVYSLADKFVPYLEINDNLYFILDAPDDQITGDYSTLQRYDGRYWNTSGLPEPSYDISGAGTGRFARAFYFHYDDNLNFVAGQPNDFEDSTTSISVAKRTAPNLSQRNFMTSSFGVDRNLGFMNTLGGVVGSTNVVQLTTNINYVNASVGDTVKFISDPVSRFIDGVLVGTFRTLVEFTIFDIDSSTPADTVVSLDLDNYRMFNDQTGEWENKSGFDTRWSGTDIVDGTVLGNVFIALYGSVGGVNWTFDSVTIALGNNLDITTEFVANVNPSSPADTVEEYPMFLELTTDYNNGFDEGAFRGLAPSSKSMAIYGGSILTIDDKNVYISDGLSQGSSVENFRGGGQSFTVGTSKDGPINGIFANENFVVVFREKEAYYVVGDIFNGNYRVQSFYSTEIGCSSPTSVVELAGYCFFASERGFYFAKQGANMEELSDVIEPVFIDDELDIIPDMSIVRSQIDFKREYVFCYVAGAKDRIFAYSYYWGEWFLLDIEANSGFCILNGVIYHSDGTKVYGEDATAKEKIKIKYSSNYETLGEPSIKKKFEQLKLYSLNNTNFTATLKTEEDWSNEVTTEEEIVLSGNIIGSQRFDSSRDYSRRFTIEINSKKDIAIDGYEYEYRAIGGKLKGNDNGKKV